MTMREYKLTNQTELGSFYNLYKQEYLTKHKGIIESTADSDIKTDYDTSSSSVILDVLYNSNNTNVTFLEEFLSPELNDHNNNGTQPATGEIFRRDYTQFLLEGVGISLMTIIGIIGNVLSIVILTRGSMQSKSINRLLLCLAITDTIYISGVLFVIAIPNIYAFYQIDFTQSLIMMTVPYVYPIGMTAQTSSVYFTITVTIERYVAVCHPIYARIICTRQRATAVSICVAIFAIVYNVPRWFEYHFIAVYENDQQGSTNNNDNSTIANNTSETVFVRYLVLTTGLRKHPIYEKYYIMFGYFTFVVSLPILILIVLNIFIYRAVSIAFGTELKHFSEIFLNEF